MNKVHGTAADCQSAGDDGLRPALAWAQLKLLHEGGIGAVALLRKSADTPEVQQWTAPLSATLRHVGGMDGGADWYASPNAFAGPRCNGNLTSLRANFIDLDFHKSPAWRDVAPDEMLETVERHLARHGIPVPALVVFSGRGLQLVWAFTRGITARALPRWKAVQRHLLDLLRRFNADGGSLDCARVLRLAGSVNQKSGKMARLLRCDDDLKVDFDHMADVVLPRDRFALRAERKQRTIKAESLAALTTSVDKRKEAARQFREAMLADIRVLIGYRWGSIIPEGARNQTLFVYGTFLVQRVGVHALSDALAEFATQVTDLDAAEVNQIVESVVRKIVSDGRGYRYSSTGAADALAVTSDEAKSAGLVKLLPTDPIMAEARRMKRRENDRVRKQQKRSADGAGKRQGQTRPWEAEGISRATYFRRKKAAAEYESYQQAALREAFMNRNEIQPVALLEGA